MAFLDNTKHRPLLFDGPMRTRLQQGSAIRSGECPELLNATHPMDVLDTHQAYLDAGADILVANTCGANALQLEKFGLQERMEELVQSGIAIASEAASAQSRKIYVASGIGPTGKTYQSDEETPTAMYRAFFAQCHAAEACGADLICIETMHDLAEARLAILAARAATKLPILCSFLLEKDDHTGAGNPPEVLSLYCSNIGASMVGVNCGSGPNELFNGYSRLAGASVLPTFALPDIGLDEKGGPAMSPEETANAMQPYLQAGISAVGFCCGNSPAHIRALRGILNEYHGYCRAASTDGEFLCSPGRRLPLHALESGSYTLLSLKNLTHGQALLRIQELAATEAILHIDFADWSAQMIDKLIFHALPLTRNTPLAFHLRTAAQANAALLAYPGIAAVYAHSDTYRVLKAAARYGAEVIS